MKRGFVRVLWGRRSDDHLGTFFGNVITNDIKLSMHSIHERTMPTTTFVYGRDNFKVLSDNGFQCELVDERPLIWEGTCMWRHKLEAMRLAMQVYKRIVYLDFDCVAVRPIPDDFWHIAEKKAPIQASLIGYKRQGAAWRREDTRKIPNGGFVYIRNAWVPRGLISVWEKRASNDKCWSDEHVMAEYIDGLMGGWRGCEYYFRNYEPDYFTNTTKTAYRLHPSCKKDKEPCFQHFMTNSHRNYLLSTIGTDSQPDWWIDS
jgi:hypothetical protein